MKYISFTLFLRDFWVFIEKNRFTGNLLKGTTTVFFK
jgi:hypothetical protein